MKSFEFNDIFTATGNGFYNCPTDRMREFKQILNDEDGYLLVKGFPLQYQNTEDLEGGLLKFCFTFGVPVSQGVKNNFILRIEDLKSKQAQGKSVEGYQDAGALPPHNDRCDFFLLFGIKSATHGGMTRFMSSKRIIEQLASQCPESYELLQKDFPCDNSKYSKKEGDVFSLPIIANTDEGGQIIWYTRWFIQNALKYDERITLTAAQYQALDDLDKAIDDNIEPYMVQEGDVVLVNNHKSLHSRQRFQEGDNRLLYRLWLSVPDGMALPASHRNLLGRTEAGAYRGGVWSDNLKLTDIPANFEQAKSEIRQHLFEKERSLAQ